MQKIFVGFEDYYLPGCDAMQSKFIDVSVKYAASIFRAKYMLRRQRARSKQSNVLGL
jgi:hypothetical protein